MSCWRGWDEKQCLWGGNFSRLCVAKSSMLWTSAEIQLLGELWPKNEMCRADLISIAWKMESWWQCE